jgi:hypothetical protein
VSLDTLFFVVYFYKKLVFILNAMLLLPQNLFSACDKVVQYELLAGDTRVFCENGNEAS